MVNHIYILFMPIYHKNNGGVNSKNSKITIEITVFSLFAYDLSNFAKCICKIREM